MQLSRMVALPLAALAGVAEAGGLYVGEFGQPNQGASRAGAHALCRRRLDRCAKSCRDYVSRWRQHDDNGNWHQLRD